MKTTEMIDRLESMENAGNATQLQFNSAVATRLKQYQKILDWLAKKTDPVKPSQFTDERGRNACVLCGAVGAVNCENVAHKPNCPWMDARTLTAST